MCVCVCVCVRARAVYENLLKRISNNMLIIIYKYPNINYVYMWVVIIYIVL